MWPAAARKLRPRWPSSFIWPITGSMPAGRLSGKSTLGNAVRYALNRWEALARYLEDGRLSIDNNLAERLLRGIALTRKSFLFLGSDAGGDRAAII